MSAAARLVLTYFTATPLVRGLAALGLVFVVTGLAGYLFIPAWTLGNGIRVEALWRQSLVLALPWLGLLLLVAASARMPAIAERIALGRLIRVLPKGRARLLASIVAPALLLALVTAVAASAAFLDYRLESGYVRIFYRTLLMAFVDFGLIYTAIWLVGKTRGVWRLAGLLWVIVSVTIPMRYLSGIPPFSPLEGLGLAAWIVLGALVLAGGRTRTRLGRLRTRALARSTLRLPAQRYTPGAETAVLLGLGQPWIIALGQVIPIGVMTWFVPESSVWIVFLMIFSAISGAMTSQAAARSRRLWLRLDELRERLFPRIERACWKYNGHSLAVLLLLFVALGAYAGFPSSTMVLGIALLALGSAVFHYLGLMITRGLGGLESTLCILTMTALTVAALAIMRENWTLAARLELLLAALVVAYRLMAKARWSTLDWMRCRAAAG